MTRRARPATIARLIELQSSGVEQAKEYARVIKALDDETAGMAARELRELLQHQHGIDLHENKINKGRYIARLLYALDPAQGDPRVLDGADDAETLYLLQRLHEVKGTPLPELLSTLEKYRAKALTNVQMRQRMKDAVARAQNRTTSESRAAWRQPLMRVPGDVCDTLNKNFSQYAKAQGTSQQQSAEALAALLTQPVAQLPQDVHEGLNSALTEHFNTLNMPFDQGIVTLTQLLTALPAVHWKSLYNAVRR